MNKVLFSKKSDNWATPKWLYDYFIKELNSYDPCPLNCKSDLLFEDCNKDIMFINPPYSNIIDFVNYGIRQLDLGNVKHVIFLIPVRSDTKYFDKLFQSGYLNCIYFIKGRLHFNESKNCASFPFCLIHLSSDFNIVERLVNFVNQCTYCRLIDQDIKSLRKCFYYLKDGD